MLTIVTRYVEHRARMDAALARGRRRALYRIGAFVRRSARQSIRRGKSASHPGSPPRTRTGFLRGRILFGVETTSVVIGVPLRSTRAGAATGPAALEYGGRTRILRRIGGRLRRDSVRIRPRPFMRLALERERYGAKLAAAFKSVLR